MIAGKDPSRVFNVTELQYVPELDGSAVDYRLNCVDILTFVAFKGELPPDALLNELGGLAAGHAAAISWVKPMPSGCWWVPETTSPVLNTVLLLQLSGGGPGCLLVGGFLAPRELRTLPTFKSLALAAFPPHTPDFVAECREFPDHYCTLTVPSDVMGAGTSAFPCFDRWAASVPGAENNSTTSIGAKTAALGEGVGPDDLADSIADTVAWDTESLDDSTVELCLNGHARLQITPRLTEAVKCGLVGQYEYGTGMARLWIGQLYAKTLQSATWKLV